MTTTQDGITQAGKTIYLNNRELLAAVKKSKELGRMSDTLARMLQLLCSKYAKKGNFINYSYNEDMQSYAMMMLVRTWNSFDPEKSNNPFAFFTQCIKNSFIQYLNQEKRQRVIRDELLVDQGMNPSYGYGDEEGSDHTIQGIEDEQDFHSLHAVVKESKVDKYGPNRELWPEGEDDLEDVADDLPAEATTDEQQS
jgi:RNA polymerase sigma factor (sigma-70 family)